MREIFEELDINKLIKDKGKMGCPFLKFLVGVMSFYHWNNYDNCKNHCGKLFPRGYQYPYCPCHTMDSDYVEKRFWKELKKAKQK